MIQEYKVPFSVLNITPEEVYEVMGYGSVTPDKELRKMVRSAIDEVAAFLIPRFCFLTVDGKLDSDILTIGSVKLNIGKIIARQLRKSERFIPFAATAGKEFEDWTNRLKEKDDVVMLFIADSLGSCLAEKTADYMEIFIQKEMDKKGWLHTNRFSPGYCEWHVSEQQKLFSLLPVDEPCGIRLTESSLMIPIKSVSGVIGVGKEVKRLDYSCGLCSFESCYKKRKNKDQNLYVI